MFGAGLLSREESEAQSAPKRAAAPAKTDDCNCTRATDGSPLDISSRGAMSGGSTRRAVVDASNRTELLLRRHARRGSSRLGLISAQGKRRKHSFALIHVEVSSAAAPAGSVPRLKGKPKISSRSHAISSPD